MEAELVLWPPGAEGRVPRFAHRRVILFFCPIRASSWNQISIGLPPACRAAVSSTMAGKLMGWPAPSASHVIVAGDSNGGRNQMQIAILGIDLGKNSCSLVGLDGQGKVVKRRRMRPASIVGFTKSLPPCIIGMEACCGAHHLGGLLNAQGHEVRLMSPEYVRPCVKAQKNDDRDAEAIAEAATRPRSISYARFSWSEEQSSHRAAAISNPNSMRC